MSVFKLRRLYSFDIILMKKSRFGEDEDLQRSVPVLDFF